MSIPARPTGEAKPHIIESMWPDEAHLIGRDVGPSEYHFSAPTDDALAAVDLRSVPGPRRTNIKATLRRRRANRAARKARKV